MTHKALKVLEVSGSWVVTRAAFVERVQECTSVVAGVVVHGRHEKRLSCPAQSKDLVVEHFEQLLRVVPRGC